MKWCAVLLFVLIPIGCREIEPFPSQTDIEGYRIEGTVTDAGGRALQGATIQMFYAFSTLLPPLDTSRVAVVNPGTRINVDVLSTDSFIIRNFEFTTSPGYLPHNIWNGLDNNGQQVKNGAYTIVVSLNGVEKKRSDWLIDGQIIATTDAEGKFFISKNNLPIGRIVDIYSVSGTYTGTYQITHVVFLRAGYNGMEIEAQVVLVLDQTTRITYSF